MKAKLTVLVLLVGLVQSYAQDERYLFFLHNRFIEEHQLHELHPEYGKAYYEEVLSAFRKAGFKVLSEKRPADTDMPIYARKITGQVDSLLALGIKPGNITVVGTSKGGYIAEYVSSFLRNPEVNFVFVGSIFDGDTKSIPEINFCGNILAIRERTDSMSASGEERKRTSKFKVNHYKDIELTTGLKHGFLFQPLKEWIEPSIQWAKGNYDL